jgi:RND family efflux transporter MFP subunit
MKGLLLCALLIAACSKGEDEAAQGGGRRGPRAFPVEVQPVSSRDVEYTISAVGSVAAFEEVQVTVRVAGVVEKVRFTEGDVVKQGQVLAEIEPERFRLAVEAAKAAMDKAAAVKAEAEAGLARREATMKENPGLIPGEELDAWRARVASATADAAERKVAWQQASLNLRDAMVKAPIAGTIEKRTVQTGQYAQPGYVIATLIRRDPLLLRFGVPEADARRVQTGLKVTFHVRGDARPFSAKVTHVAAEADARSRMVSIAAEIDDPNKESLGANSFAEVSIPVGGTSSSPVVPQIAVRPSERGFLAFVVEDGVAKERILELGMRTADGLVEVKNGLRVGEQLVVRGAEALRDGAPVQIGGAKRAGDVSGTKGGEPR